MVGSAGRFAMRSLAVLTVALALVGGCGTTERSPSDSIVGNWVTDRYATHAEFRDDGTYGKGYAVPNPSEADLEWGTWSTDGKVLTLNPDAATDACADKVGTYEIDVIDDGNRIEVTVLDDDCGLRAMDFGSGLTRNIDDGS